MFILPIALVHKRKSDTHNIEGLLKNSFFVSMTLGIKNSVHSDQVAWFIFSDSNVPKGVSESGKR